MFLILGPFVEIGLVIVSEKVSIATSGWSDNSYTFTLLSQRAPGCRIHRFWDLLVHTNSSLRGPTFPLGLSGHEIRGLQQRSVGRELAEGYVVVSSWPPLHPHLLLWLLPAQLQGLWGQGFWQRSVARVPFLCVCVCVRVCACVCVCVFMCSCPKPIGPCGQGGAGCGCCAGGPPSSAGGAAIGVSVQRSRTWICASGSASRAGVHWPDFAFQGLNFRWKFKFLSGFIFFL